MDIAKLAGRCTTAESCLPDAPYKTYLCGLHKDMLDEITRLRAELDAAKMDAERLKIVAHNTDNKALGKVCLAVVDAGYGGFSDINLEEAIAAIDAARGKDND